MPVKETISIAFKSRFNGRYLLVRSPGRINLLGEHTDYNLGFVWPAAIDKAAYFAVSPRTDGHCRIYSVNLNQAVEFSLHHLQKSDLKWPNYLLGVIDQALEQKLPLSGFDCTFGSDIPLGAGLSSSAALCTGLAFALNELNQWGLDRLSLAQMGQKSENNFVGVQCGIMDQYVNVFGQAGRVLCLDCCSMTHRSIPFADSSVELLLINSNVSHSLASSGYNQRRAECAAGISNIAQFYPQVQSLRDVTSAMLQTVAEKLDPLIFRRCRSIVWQNEQQPDALAALENHDMITFGRLMNTTHRSLSEDYQVSCPELDFLAATALSDPAVLGARMMGGGFGGCTINLIRTAASQRVSALILEKYKKKFSLDATVIPVKIGPGTTVVQE
jgi:galactokinase